MAGTGACPVSASPQRPTQPVGGIGDGPNDQGRKQVPDLVVARSALPVVSVGRVRSWPPPPGGRGRAWQGWPTDTRSARGAPGAGPARPGPCWSAGAPRWPSAARRPGPGESAAPGEGAAAVESQLAGALVAADHEPVLACWPGGSRALMVQAQKRPAVQALAFGVLAARDLLPCPRGDLPDQGVGTVGGDAASGCHVPAAQVRPELAKVDAEAAQDADRLVGPVGQQSHQ